MTASTAIAGSANWQNFSIPPRRPRKTRMILIETTISQKTALMFRTPSVLVPVAWPKKVAAVWTCSLIGPVN